MAIKIELKREDNDNKASYKHAYIKISNIRIDVDRNVANIELTGYADESARNIDKANGVYKDNIKCTLEEFGLNTLKLKKDQTYSDAVKALGYKHISQFFKEGKNI